MVYIGADWCKPCHKPSLKKALEKLKLTLHERAKEHNMGYSVMGIANDHPPKKGWEFIQSNGYFDEVIVGREWFNSGSIDFLINRSDSLPSVPQVIVFEREIDIGNDIKIGEKNILVRLKGNEIEEWIENGADLNMDS